MHLIGETGFSILVFVMMTIQAGSMLVYTGRFIQIKPEGEGRVAIVNCWNTLVLLLFFALLFLKPKLKIVLIASLLISIALTAPMLDKEFEYGIGDRDENNLTDWLILNGFSQKVAIDKKYSGSYGERRIQESLIFWWRGDFIHTNLEGILADGAYFITIDDYSDSYPIVATRQIRWNTWYLYKLQ